MDGPQFDEMTKSLDSTFSRPGDRRGLLGALSALPLTGVLTALLGDGGTTAKERQQGPGHSRDQFGNDVVTEKSSKKKRKKRK
ncbi:MAG: hypothetical protein KC442_02130, partial [Thermomicrobiales bacterium]|nr:hypothetical protein [Thermomicrobiales bacterium]